MPSRSKTNKNQKTPAEKQEGEDAVAGGITLDTEAVVVANEAQGTQRSQKSQRSRRGKDVKCEGIAKLSNKEPILAMKVHQHVPEYKAIFEGGLGTIHYNQETKCYEAHAVSKLGHLMTLKDPGIGPEAPVRYVSQPPRHTYVPKKDRTEDPERQRGETNNVHGADGSLSIPSVLEPGGASLDISSTVVDGGE